MGIWRLVSGILSCIMFALVAFQSCAVGVGNALVESEEVSGSAGLIVAILLLAGGIVSIVVRNSSRKGPSIALIILYGLGCIIGFTMAGSYSDLKVWAAWCLICAVMAIVAVIRTHSYSGR